MIYNINMSRLKFDDITGYLKSGIYPITIDELLSHPILGNGKQRQRLIKSLSEACNVYWQYGIDEIYANGSFATMKPIPNDIDGYIIVDTQSEQFKKLAESGNIWGIFKGKKNPKDKFPMWYEHKIEFYIENKNIFHYFFTHSRDGIERGIIKIIK